ncbi:hypothetical protein BJY21_003082 [Kineosphaera limosa]|uniref:Uncharacterized protein n=1 Tax=Kineosphaera limosa NBRC 100340 TaxID=1184609 RepID=K6WA95_9MICO|nr:cell wall-binding repeat-containing protein [Kineosphaera limosa]NYE01898.1 hypothetical protein [Kineosphaera limosa]GAB96125.1 hypothetical protein KILIM_032_00100 [Kineosphaera limosa NBRC 100340]
MSSAAKLRTLGRGTAVIASAALVMTSFGPAAFAAWDVPPQGGSITSQPDPAVGIVDTDQKAAGTQGATLVQAGQDAQDLNDLRLVLPNSFQRGDVIDLRVFDRSATQTNNGRGNAGPSTKMEFSADPDVAVSDPIAGDSIVGTTGRANADVAPIATTHKNETETGTGNPWQAATGATGLAAQRPGVTPAFEVSRVASTGSSYRDTIRLRVTSDPSTGDPNARWGVRLQNLKVDLGAQVTPGELRIVPFAYNGQTDKLIAAPDLFGNIEAQAFLNASDRQPQRQILVYTVPGYVAPVRFDAGNPNITAQAGAQSIGDLKITETHGASLTQGSYTVAITGATIANTNTSELRATISDGGTTETVSIGNWVTTGSDRTGFTFNLANTDVSRVSTITVSGLMLNGTAPGRLSFQLSGGSVDQWLADGGQSQAVMNNGTQVVAGSPAFVGSGATASNAGVTSASGTQTGASQLTTGDYTIAVATGGGVLELRDKNGDVVGRAFVADPTAFTLAAPYSGTVGFSRDVVAGETVRVRGTQAQSAALTRTPPTTSSTVAGTWDAATYSVVRLDDGTLAMRAAGSTTNYATSTDGLTFNRTGATAGSVVLDADGAIAGDSYAISTIAVTTVSAVPDNTAALPGASTITPDPAAGASTTLLLPPTGTYTAYNYVDDGWVLEDASGNQVATSTDAAVWTLVGDYSGTITLNSSTGPAVPAPLVDTAEVTINTGATVATVPMANPTVTISGPTPAAGTFTVDGTDLRNTANAIVASTTDGGRTFVGTGPLAGTTFTASAVLLDGATIVVSAVAGAINQVDIEGPLDSLIQVGTVSAGTAAIGGTNRFDTARKIAHLFGGNPDIAIVVNGLNAPDALSAGFLSQREGAPILLATPRVLPQETVEALRDRGVRKVYVVGGEAAVGRSVTDQLRNQDAYMWDDAAKAIKPRGGKLEVVQLGGANRYATNWVVNTYAAAQTANSAPVGKIATGYGQPLKTTGLVARGDQFVDALTANVLSAGRTGALTRSVAAGESVKSIVAASGFPILLTPSDVDKFAVGIYTVSGTSLEVGGDQVGLVNAGTGLVEPTTVGTSTVVASNAYLSGNVQFSAAPSGTFRVTATQATSAQYIYDANATARVNALPVVLTSPDGLRPEAAAQFRAMHLEHALLIGGDSALSDSVKTGIEGINNASTLRLAGADRWATAKVVNEFAMRADTATQAGDVPGLGFRGNRVYTDAAGTTLYSGEMTAYLANGLRFPDALVAGPMVSRQRNALVMTLQNELPDPTKAFLVDNAARIDNAVGLGLGQAVSTAVITEANRLAATR